MTFEKIHDDMINDKLTLKEAKNMITSKDKWKTINYFIHKDKFNNSPLKDGELSQLIAIVGILQMLYNSSMESPVSDYDYDTLQEMLVDMGIPRLTGSIEINASNKLDHKYPNLRGTLAKIYYLDPSEKRTNKSRKYMHEWVKKQQNRYEKITGESIDLYEKKVLCQPKFDGVSCTKYRDTKTVWLTRGDTDTNKASDVSHIMNIYNGWYDQEGEHAIKHEVMISEESKENINKLLTDKPYKNSRQIVTSVLNSNEPDPKAEYLYPVPLRIMKNGDSIEEIHPDLVRNFPTLICKLSETDKIREFANQNKYVVRNGVRYRTDGVVITIIDQNIQKILGRENNINNFEVAYKFTEEFGYTKVRDVIFETSEFGFICPVLLVNDITLKGNTISRISLSNKERFDELDLSYGDDIKVLYDIIPYATRDENCFRNKKGNKIKFIERCPVCRGDLDLDVIQVQCKNPNCTSRILGRILNYCKTLNIQNIGYETLESLYKGDLLNKGIRSLYKLKKKRYEIENLEGFGKLKAKKIIAEIEAKRRLKDAEFFGAIGIETLSVKTFELIFNKIRYKEFLELVFAKNFSEIYQRITTIKGIGDKKGDVLIEYLKNTNNRNELQKLLGEVSIYESYGEITDIKGVIVFTGCRPTPKEKATMLDRGWKTSDTWNDKAKFLIIPQSDYHSIKIDKAREKGIDVVLYKDLKNIQ